MDDAFRWVREIFERKSEDGEFFYSTEDVLDFLPVMLLSFGFDAAKLHPKLQILIAEFADRAGLEPGMSKADVEKKVQRYLEASEARGEPAASEGGQDGLAPPLTRKERPLNKELVFEFMRAVREERATRGADGVAQAFSKFMAANDRRFDAMLSKKRPEGTVAAGPLARFAMLGANGPGSRRPK